MVTQDQLPNGCGVASCKALIGLDSFVWWFDSTLVRFPFPDFFFFLSNIFSHLPSLHPTLPRTDHSSCSQTAQTMFVFLVPFQYSKPSLCFFSFRWGLNNLNPKATQLAAHLIFFVSIASSHFGVFFGGVGFATPKECTSPTFIHLLKAPGLPWLEWSDKSIYT